MTDQAIITRFNAAVESLPIESWQAWKLGEQVSYPIAIHAETLPDVLQQAMAGTCWNPGDRLAVQHSHAGRKEHVLRLYTVRKSKAGFWRDASNGGRKVFVPLLIPTLDIQIPLTAPFAPVEAFDAFRDNAVGLDLTLVSQ